MITIAIDTGGTFTDYTAAGTLDGGPHRRIFVKNPTNHDDPAAGILAGLEQLAQAWGCSLSHLLSQTSRIAHGATLALNALLEKKGATTALLTTDGFRDALEIRRSQLENQWDLRALAPEVLVPRRRRIGIPGRMDYKGDELTPLDENAVRAACQQFKAQNVESVAVCYLFSFLNPIHEKRTAEIIHDELPDVFVTLSSDVAPRIREYERTSTTVLNAYLTPVLAGYLNRITAGLAQFGWTKPVHIMQNNGGLSDTDAMADYAVKTLLSGPAGGAVGNAAIGRLTNCPNTVLADMGGTSFDLHVVSDGQTRLIPQSELAGYPLSIPMIDITSIGAGGGSIASVDAGGRVLIGPESAGSDPGPACYGLGGTRPTVTDALLILGLLDSSEFLGGRMQLSMQAAETAMNTHIATPLGISVADAARIVYRITTETMADALRLVTMERGNDPRAYQLIAAGGAFALFAGPIVSSLHMAGALIPIQGPVFCAWGMMGASRRYDLTRSFFMDKGHFDSSALQAMINTMQDEGSTELNRLGVDNSNQRFDVTLEMRYLEQHHEISVPLPSEGLDMTTIDAAFHSTHQSIYAYAQPDVPWEIVDVHIGCAEVLQDNTTFLLEGPTPSAETRTLDGDPFGLSGMISVPVYGASHLTAPILGPALIVLDYTTVVVPKDYHAHCPQEGIISLEKEASHA